MAQQSLAYYLERYAAGVLTTEEQDILKTLLRDPANEEALNRILDADWDYWENSGLDFPEGFQRIERAVAGTIATREVLRPVHRVHFLRTA